MTQKNKTCLIPGQSRVIVKQLAVLFKNRYELACLPDHVIRMEGMTDEARTVLACFMVITDPERHIVFYNATLAQWKLKLDLKDYYYTLARLTDLGFLFRWRDADINDGNYRIAYNVTV